MKNEVYMLQKNGEELCGIFSSVEKAKSAVWLDGRLSLIANTPWATEWKWFPGKFGFWFFGKIGGNGPDYAIRPITLDEWV